MESSNYSDKVNWLFNQFPVFQKVGAIAYKPTLDNTNRLISFLNIPIDTMHFVHVAGTNGKGTTCSIIASGLTEAGKKVGLFTSPHIKDFRERIRINGEMISENEVVELIERFQEAEFDFSPSFFEMTWVMALHHFCKQGCDIIVVETGLGGRLDATNVIKPVLSVITNIGLDHVAILGDTRPKIAVEKAGIIKENIPVIIGESDEEIEGVFLKAAIKKKAPIYIMDNGKGQSTFERNKAVAFKVIDFLMKNDLKLNAIKDKAIQSLYKNTGLFGRNQVISEHPLIIVDAGHNVMGVERFIKDIQTKYPNRNIRALYGASNDKDVQSIVHLFPKNWNYFITEFGSERSMKIEEFREIKEIVELKPKYYTNSFEAYEEAKSFDNECDVLVVFGSFYLLEEII